MFVVCCTCLFGVCIVCGLLYDLSFELFDVLLSVVVYDMCVCRVC